MTKPRFAKRWACAWAVAAVLTASPVWAQDQPQPEQSTKPGKPINAGDVLSGELTAMRVKSGKQGKRVATYQITSEPRRLPPPAGLCNLETGPETFQLVTTSEAQAAQLKSLVGKEISVTIGEIACANAAGQVSEAVITKWNLVTKR